MSRLRKRQGDGASPPRESLLAMPPRQMAAIRSLGLRARLIVEGTTAGMHRSPYHGFSAQFLEFRPYHPAESTRFIDWRTLARTDRCVVRVHEDETNLSAHMLLDTSASMSLATQEQISKFEYARTLCAALAWILIRQRDAVGLCTFDARVRTTLAPRSTQQHWSELVGRLEQITPAQTTRCGACLDAFAPTLTRRGICVVLSDLLDSAPSLERGLRHLRFKRQDVIVIEVLDPLERTFACANRLRVVDLETGHTVEIDGSSAAQAYARGYERHRGELESLCRNLGVERYTVWTDEPFRKALGRILQRRGR